jgi:hypothetical protein
MPYGDRSRALSALNICYVKRAFYILVAYSVASLVQTCNQPAFNRRFAQCQAVNSGKRSGLWA